MVKPGRMKLFRQKLQSPVGRGVEVGDASQGIGIYLGRSEGSKNYSLVRAYARAFIHGMRVAPLEQNVLFGTHHEKRGAECKQEKAR